MPGYLLHASAVMNCPHSAPVTVPSSQGRVTVNGQFVAVQADLLTVTGCPYQIPTPGGPVPQPCVPVKWTNLSTRLMVAGQPVLLQTPPDGSGNGICFSATQIPAGPPHVAVMQQRVTGA